ncbi:MULTISPECIES: nuclear transport factor 2 family protein [Acinetobacter]|uniref:SnoaL-like domain-containing protein n=1 Tax=Acinetobacter parvus DSM 16617 = CIP 108168 TaxID=981333 RepID=N8QG28_9GAMM|nr:MULTISPECIES: nuclear transport factor 2 family protein [Acinetobacter]ENU37510.1 hypothetical protein F988_00313 [Acinetobacter parvus DSM 16617 = CIP 108168]MCU4392676.1 nuclear transport factor 2 family protein [Acinetobacter parvus]
MNFEQKKAVIRRYFQYIDNRDSRILDLYTEDVELLFPKFGRHYGKEAMILFAERMTKMLNQLQHDIENLVFLDAGEKVVVEGREWGEMADGTPFPDGKVSQGLFCNIFEFRDQLISSVHIYADPDLPSLDHVRIKALALTSS